MIIICLFLSSCQLNNQQLVLTTTPQTIEKASSFSSVTEEESSFCHSQSSEISSVTNPFQAASTAAHIPALKPNKSTIKASEASQELRGVWISCYDHISAVGKTKSEYKAATDEMFKTIKDCGLNTAFVHLRAFSDAFYESEIYPYSSFIAGKEGADLAFDPFEIMLKSAQKYDISVHGWINPFRVSTKTDVSMLSRQNPAKQILDSGNPDGEICILSNGIYYNPSCTSNHKRILDGVKEIISKYDIDGIHIDDYFYPSTEEIIDKKQYSEYISEGGTLSLSKWRKAHVDSFVSSLYSAVKAADPALTVSISPAAEIDKNSTQLYADCELWLASPGYADIIIPQIYYGFDHETLDFSNILRQWSLLPRNSKVKLACGIAAYKCGKTDKYAGTGSAEWQENSDILARQLAALRNNKSYSGFVVFSYRDLISEVCKTEIQNLKDTIKTGN